jgi:stage V sporulation protein R
VAGKRLDKDRMVWQYYVKSRKAVDYRQMLLDALYHPPHIDIDNEKGDDNTLYLVHHFEGKPLVKEFVANTMLGLEYLWGHPVQLETSEVVSKAVATASGYPVSTPGAPPPEGAGPTDFNWERVVYTMKKRELKREVIGKA